MGLKESLPNMADIKNHCHPVLTQKGSKKAGSNRKTQPLGKQKNQRQDDDAGERVEK